MSAQHAKMLQIGWASDSITSNRPVYLSGQLYTRVSKYVHDPVTATALVLANSEDQCILISCDMVGILATILESLRARFAGDAGIDPGKISISATHTHTNSRFNRAGPLSPFMTVLGADALPETETPADILTGQEAEDFLVDRLEQIVRQAWQSRQPGGISWAQDYAAIGFNRRPRFMLAGGSSESVMYGCCDSAEFMGFEGPTDSTINMLYTWDVKRNLTGVVVGVPCPSQVMELHYYVSADYWHNARKSIRERCGNIHVLALCEAAGDQNPLDLVRLSKNNHQELKDWNAQAGEVWINTDPGQECEKIGLRIRDAVQRGLEQAKSTILYALPFAHQVQHLSLPLRKVCRTDYDAAQKHLATAQARVKQQRLSSEEVIRLFEPLGVIARWDLQQLTDAYDFEAHFIRIGNTVIATNPFELFVEYSLRIRARCHAEQLINVQLANNIGGYLPTQTAVDGGSYSSKPASTKVGPEGGNMLVERYIGLINDLLR